MKLLELANQYLKESGEERVLVHLDSDSFYFEECYVCFDATEDLAHHLTTWECSMHYSEEKGQWDVWLNRVITLPRS